MVLELAMTTEVVMIIILLAIFGWLMHDFCTMNPLSQSETIYCVNFGLMILPACIDMNYLLEMIIVTSDNTKRGGSV